MKEGKPKHIDGVTVRVSLDHMERSLIIMACREFLDREKGADGNHPAIRKFGKVRECLDISELTEFNDASMTLLDGRKELNPNARLTESERRGVAADFVFMPSVFAFITSTVQSCRWQAALTDDVVRLLDKLNVKQRDASIDFPDSCYA